MGNRSLDDFLASGDDSSDEAADNAAEATTDGEATDESPTDGTSDAASGGKSADETTEEATEETAGDTVEADAENVETVTAAVEPAVSTYAGRSGECAVCGERVDRRWHSDDGLVCPECKEW